VTPYREFTVAVFESLALLTTLVESMGRRWFGFFIFHKLEMFAKVDLNRIMISI
jgi:hypothetical protein